MQRQTGIVLDACALIDIVDHDRRLLRLVVIHVAPIVIARPVLNQVLTLDEAEAAELGFRIVDVADDLLDQAARLRSRLSFEDSLCVLVAQAERLPCVTGDARMSAVCAAAGIEWWPALRPLCLLVEAGALDAKECLMIVRQMRARNAYITTPVMQAFEKELRTAERRRSRR